jgi:TolB-like protein
VLPFVNVGGEPADECFADGITDDLITGLAQLSGLVVIARNTAFGYQGRPVAAAEVARELGVRHAVEGSVRRAGERLRINIELLDTRSGAHLWAERLDRDATDVFTVQDVAFSLHGDHGRAIGVLERARTVAPKVDNLQAVLAVAYARAGRLAEARAAAAEARRLGPSLNLELFRIVYGNFRNPRRPGPGHRRAALGRLARMAVRLQRCRPRSPRRRRDRRSRLRPDMAGPYPIRRSGVPADRARRQDGFSHPEADRDRGCVRGRRPAL